MNGKLNKSNQLPFDTTYLPEMIVGKIHLLSNAAVNIGLTERAAGKVPLLEMAAAKKHLI